MIVISVTCYVLICSMRKERHTLSTWSVHKQEWKWNHTLWYVENACTDIAHVRKAQIPVICVS